MLAEGTARGISSLAKERAFRQMLEEIKREK
jgi:hypothetical protein